MESNNREPDQLKEQVVKSPEVLENTPNDTEDILSAKAPISHESKAIWEQDVKKASPITARSSKDRVDSRISSIPTVQTPASLCDKYTFIKEIGHGTQGRIYLAENNADHFQVAIKQLMIESVTNWKAYELFHREAEVLSSLKIRGVARFYDAIECLEDNPPCSYIVQEYIPGQSLNDMLKAGHRFSLDRVYDIILQLLGIIGKLWLHDPPVIHRDIKPSNIILKPLSGDEFTVYLIDFGAVANPQVQGGGSTVAGTFGYMPPEQLMGKPVLQSDIYSLAAVAVHLITGISPANMPVKDFHLIFEPDMQNMPPALVQTLRGMLDPNVENRLCDLEDLCHRFLDFSHAVYDKHIFGQDVSLSDEAYLAQLKNVQYYGQDGNIELWQRLPDQTPRFETTTDSDDESDDESDEPNVENESDTKEMDDQSEQARKDGMFLAFRAENLSDSPSSSNSSQPSEDIAQPFSFERQFKALLSEIRPPSEYYDFYQDEIITESKSDFWNQIGICVLAFVFALFFSSYVFEIKYISLIIVILFIASIGYIYISHIRKLKVHLIECEKKVFYPENHRITDSQAKDYLLDELWYLLKNGRKTIATIVGIDYIQNKDYNVESKYIDASLFKGTPQYEDMLNEAELQKKSCVFSSHGRPNFEIHYKFNPPDDMREEDLVHTIVVHIEPEGHYAVGDPLPIIYMIMSAREREIKERVISMPFPFPLEDPVLYTDVIFGDACIRDNATPTRYSKSSKKDTTHRNVYELLDYFKTAPRKDYGEWGDASKEIDKYTGIQLTKKEEHEAPDILKSVISK